MKRTTFIISFLFIGLSVFGQGQVVMPMTINPADNSIHFMASLNDESYDFIFDTGASGILINKNVYDDLMRKGKISRADSIGTARSIMADGSTKEITLLNIKKLSFGGQDFNNVTIGYLASSQAALLFGGDALNSYGVITIDKSQNRLILSNTSGANTQTGAGISALKEIKLIPCSADDQAILPDLKALLEQSTDFSNVSISVEAQVPRMKAVNRITQGTLTVRYFSNADKAVADSQEISNVLDNFIQKYSTDFNNSAVIKENMLAAFQNRAIPNYIEIWIRKN